MNKVENWHVGRFLCVNDESKVGFVIRGKEAELFHNKNATQVLLEEQSRKLACG